MKMTIMYPIENEVSDEKKIKLYDGINRRARKNKIEIHNSEGNIVGIVTKKSFIKMLNLEQGFYFIREKDKNSNTINSGMMVI